MINIFAFDVEAITVSDSTFQEDPDRDRQMLDTFIIEFIDIIVLIFLSFDFEVSQQMSEWILYLHQKYLSKYILIKYRHILILISSISTIISSMQVPLLQKTQKTQYRGLMHHFKGCVFIWIC